MHSRYDGIVSRIVQWANEHSRIHAVVVVGSQARTEPPPDEWSDLDVVLFSEVPAIFIQDRSWIRYIGNPEVHFVEPSVIGNGVELRVLYDELRDVDFIFDPIDAIDLIPEDPMETDLFSRGYQILLDKDGHLTTTLASLPIAASLMPAPSVAEFINTISDFHYHCVWTVKKLKRGEILIAKECLDIYLKQLILRVTGWQRTLEGFPPKPGRLSRFFEQWGPEETVELLRQSYAIYDSQDIGKKVQISLEGFSKSAQRVALHLETAYPHRQEEAIKQHINTLTTGLTS